MSTPLRRLSLFAVLLFLGAVLVSIAPAADGDIWWHLAAGREMMARGSLLFADPFSVGANGRAWADVHWLFQLAVYGIHRSFGLAGLVWTKCLVVACGALLLFGALERKRGSWARPLFVTLLLAALFAARGLLLVRPVIVSLVFLAAFFAVLERFRRDGQARRLWVLPLLQVLWANFQGLSALGPALVFAYAVASGLSAALSHRPYWPFAREASPGVDEARHFRVLAATSVGCFVAAAATPFGFGGALLPTRLLARLLPGASNVFAHSVAENVPPFVLERWSGEFWHLKWAFAVLALAVLAGGRSVRFSHALVLSAFAVLALMSNRNVLLFYWLAAPIAAMYAAPALRRWATASGPRLGRRAAIGLNAVALALLLSTAGVAAAREPRLDQPTPFRMPTNSVRYLAGLPEGDVFTADHQGGYLIWSLYPRFRPYLDTRLILRSAEEFEEYLGLADEPRRFAAFQARHHFSYVVLPVAYPDRYLNLIETLYASPEWKLAFSDGSEVLFARRDIAAVPTWNMADPTTTQRMLASIDRTSSSPVLNAASRLHLATLDVALGEFDQAERVVSASALPESEALLARCRLGAGNVAAAKEIGERLLERNQRDVSSLNLMAQIALRSGQVSRAIPFLKRALRVDPFDPEANQLLANLEEIR